MNQALGPTSLRGLSVSSASAIAASLAASMVAAESASWTAGEDVARLRRLQSLLALLSLYAAALLVVITVSDGADIGCILGGIAGHVLYATFRMASAWRDAASLDDARLRIAARRLRHAYAR